MGKADREAEKADVVVAQQGLSGYLEPLSTTIPQSTGVK